MAISRVAAEIDYVCGCKPQLDRPRRKAMRRCKSMAFELAATFVTELSFLFEMVSPDTSAIKFQVGARKEELCRSNS